MNNPSSLARILDNCTAGRSAYYSLFPVIPCAGVVHSLHLIIFIHLFAFQSLFMIVNSGYFLTTSSPSECVHRKILRTILGLPIYLLLCVCSFRTLGTHFIIFKSGAHRLVS